MAENKQEKTGLLDKPENKQEKTGLLDKLWSGGIPVRKAEFMKEINNADRTPLSDFNLDSEKRERQVDMRLTPQGLLCHQKSGVKNADGTFPLEEFLVPLALVKRISFT